MEGIATSLQHHIELRVSVAVKVYRCLGSFLFSVCFVSVTLVNCLKKLAVIYQGV